MNVFMIQNSLCSVYISSTQDLRAYNVRLYSETNNFVWSGNSIRDFEVSAK